MHLCADNGTTEETAGLEESGAQPAHLEAWPRGELSDGHLFLGGGLALALATPQHAAAPGGDGAARPLDGSHAEAELRSIESAPVRQAAQDAAPEAQAGLESAGAAAGLAAASEAMEVGQAGGQAEASPAALVEASLAALEADAPTAAPLDAGSEVASLGDVNDVAAAEAVAAVVAPVVQDAEQAIKTAAGVTSSAEPAAAAPAGLVAAAGAQQRYLTHSYFGMRIGAGSCQLQAKTFGDRLVLSSTLSLLSVAVNDLCVLMRCAVCY